MPTHLSGISTYCFRWCERCPFTLRCSVFEMGKQTGEASVRDYAVPRALPALSGSYPAFLERLDRQLAAEGLSVSAIQAGTSYTVASLRVQSRQIVLNYMSGSEWVQRILRLANYSSPAVQAAHVLNWYVLMLGPKIQRALKGWEESTEPHGDYYYQDSRRTAYLVLLATARATAAATVLLEDGTPPRPRLLEIVRQLIGISQGMRNIFPDVSLFPRPFWDYEPYTSEQLAYYDGHPPLDPFRDGLWSFSGQRAPGGG